MTFILIGALCTFLVLFLVMPIFVVWVGTQAAQASKYRELLRLAAEQPATLSTGWEVVYKEGRKQHTVIVQGNTEAEAMKELMKLQVPFDKIVSINKK